MTVLLLALAGCAAAPTTLARDGQTVVVTLHEGQAAPVAGTDLIIRVEQVKDSTSQGCLGGPIGCRDHVLLDLRRGAETRTVLLYVGHTEFQRQQGIDQAQVLGYAITLTELRGKDVTLNIRPAQ